jgi:hypothetical protein
VLGGSTRTSVTHWFVAIVAPNQDLVRCPFHRFSIAILNSVLPKAAALNIETDAMVVELETVQ